MSSSGTNIASYNNHEELSNAPRVCPRGSHEECHDERASRNGRDGFVGASSRQEDSGGGVDHARSGAGATRQRDRTERTVGGEEGGWLALDQHESDDSE